MGYIGTTIRIHSFEPKILNMEDRLNILHGHTPLRVWGLGFKSRGIP